MLRSSGECLVMTQLYNSSALAQWLISFIPYLLTCGLLRYNLGGTIVDPIQVFLMNE